jgi:hypothetical protein
LQIEFLNWLIADFPLFGWEAQNWMVVVTLLFAFYLCAYSLSASKHRG